MRSVEDIAQRLSQALPPQFGPIRDELQANFRAILHSQLARLELVPREEFEASREMLVHARDKLTALERRVAELEAGQGD